MSRRRDDPLKKILAKQRATIRDRVRESVPDAGLGPLLVIDQSPILADWRRKCRESESELKEITTELESFHTDAAPAYSLWLSSSFGEVLTSVRELSEALHDAETLAAAVHAEAEASKVTDRQAYQTVMKRKKNGEELFPRSFFTEDEGWDEGWSDVDPFMDYSREDRPGHSHHSPEDDSEKSEEENSSDRTERESSFGAFGRFVDSAKERQAKSPDEMKVRSLYRRLAFLLHPDANPNLTERERQIWNEVQAAYETKDAERLELLLLRVESGSSEWLEKVDQASVLRTVWETKQKELRIARAEISRLHRDPAWKFWSSRRSESARRALKEETESLLVKNFLKIQSKFRILNARFERYSGKSSPFR